MIGRQIIFLSHTKTLCKEMNIVKQSEELDILY